MFRALGYPNLRPSELGLDNPQISVYTVGRREGLATSTEVRDADV